MSRSPGLWLGLLSATTVLYLVASDAGRTSPGPLATVHQRVPELAGRGGCSECHGGWTSSMADACLDCHAVVGEQMDAGAGLHGRLTEAEAANCALCHSDHHGASFDIVNVQSFAAAGVPDPEAFDHGSVGFRMAGEHLSLDCSECHANARVDVLAEGTHRFLGLSRDCGSCHEDAHDGEYALSCTACHGQDSFVELASEGHEAFLALTGAHGEPACAECHPETGAHSLALLGTGRRRAAQRECLDCHESPHRAAFLEGVARRDRTPLQASCEACHDPELHAEFRDESTTLTPAQHALTGFPLDAPHADLGCAACHAAEAADFAARFPGRGADQCALCHEDPHGGQFDEGPYAARGCLACHDRHRFEPHHFDARDHARAGVPLEGSHRDADCHACHAVPHEGLPREFRGTTSDCAQCHADAHEGFFDPFLAAAAEKPARAGGGARAEAAHGLDGSCARCHLPTTFRDLADEPFDHGRWTGFAVEGAHAQTGCETCHPRSAEADARGRTLGRVGDHFGDHVGCITCHADPHGGRFGAEHLPEEVGGRAGCARCHDSTSFRSFPNGFFHNMWTGFRLTGRHRELDCSACHARLPEPDGLGRTWAEAAGSSCYDCHADPHAGQFRRDGLTDCSRCHASAAGWGDLSFDHDRDSRFPLEESHRELDCAACHEGWDLGNGLEVIRYRPMARECHDCHGVHEERMRDRARGGR